MQMKYKINIRKEKVVFKGFLWSLRVYKITQCTFRVTFIKEKLKFHCTWTIKSFFFFFMRPENKRFCWTWTFERAIANMFPVCLRKGRREKWCWNNSNNTHVMERLVTTTTNQAIDILAGNWYFLLCQNDCGYLGMPSKGEEKVKDVMNHKSE